MSISDRTGNYRDVGEALGLWLEPSPIPSGVLLRGGKLDTLTSAFELGNPRTILNPRRGPDPRHLEGVAYLHVPAANDVENYDTSQREVRAWLARAVGVLARPDTAWPVYVHCTSGRDRTGLVVAAALFPAGPVEVEGLLRVETAMTTTQGARCPSCGTWIAAERLDCICGFQPRHEAGRAIASSLLAWVAACAALFLVWAPPLSLCVWPLGVLALTSAAYGVRCGLRAVKGKALDKVLGVMALLLCAAFFIVPIVLLVTARLR